MRKAIWLMVFTLCHISGASWADQFAGYLVDSRGDPVRTGYGACVHSGSWSERTPGAGCDATPDRIVLLPAPDGKVGAVVIRAGGGEKLLDSAYAAAEVSRGGGIVERREDDASVRQRYGTTLAAQPPRPVSYTVYFATGSATELTAESIPVVASLKAALAARPAPEITVIGHTDTVGGLETNDKLSLKRAQAVRDILVAAGIGAGSIDAAGRGERELLVPTADDVDEPRNRRVEISVR